MNKIFFWTLIIVALSALIYFGLKQEKVFGFSFGPGFSFLKEHVLSLPKDYDQDFVSFRNSISEKGKETVSSLKNLFNKETDGLKDEGKSLIGQTTSKTKGKIFGVVEESLNKTEDMAGKILGVESNPAADGFGLLTEAIIYLIKINAPLSFVIKNPFSQAESKDIKYKIDWGDEKQNEGELLSGQSIMISHAWSKEGHYFVKFKIIAVDLNTFDYQIKVSAIK